MFESSVIVGSIIISFTLLLILYFAVSKREKSFFNFLSPNLILFLPTNYIFELIYISENGYSGSAFAYLFVYLNYTIIFYAVACGYYSFSSKNIGIPFGYKNIPSSCTVYFLTIASIIIYLPVLIEYKDFLLQPRIIYTFSRTGSGIYYFTSATLTLIAFTLFLFKKTVFKGEKIIGAIVCSILIYLHGSKGQFLTIVMIYLIYNNYVLNRNFNFGKIVFYLVGIGCISLALLYATFAYFTSDGMSLNEFISTIAGYSDYSRNAVQLIDSNLEPFWGKLTFETEFYARIPRALFPDKKSGFGVLYLSKLFYPSDDDYFPSFGILGLPYADFGVLSLGFNILSGLINGVLIKVFLNRLKAYKLPSDLIMVSFLCGVTYIHLGIAYLLPEHFIIALLIATFIKISGSHKKKTHHPLTISQQWQNKQNT